MRNERKGNVTSLESQFSMDVPKQK